jgi:hypothetical protein
MPQCIADTEMKTVSYLTLVVICAVMMAPRLASAQCIYRMNDVGRPHGYLSGPCNGSALGYAAAYPSRTVNASGYAGAYPNRTVNFNAVKKAPRPRVKKLQ